MSHGTVGHVHLQVFAWNLPTTWNARNPLGGKHADWLEIASQTLMKHIIWDVGDWLPFVDLEVGHTCA